VANLYDLIVRLSGDGTKLREDIDKDIAKMDELDAAIEDKNMTVNVDATAAEEKLLSIADLRDSISDKSFSMTANATEAEDALYALQLQIDALTADTMTITADSAEANQALDDLKVKADEFRSLAVHTWITKASKTTTLADLDKLIAKGEEFRLALAAIPAHLLDSEAQTQMNELLAKYDAFHDKTVVVTVDEVGAGGTGGSAGGGVVGGAGGAANKKGSPLLPTILAASPLAGPVGAATMGGAGGLLSALAPGLAGGAGFGVVAAANLKPVLTAMTALTAAQNQYNAAVTNAQRLTAIKAEQAALAGLDGEQKKALLAAEAFKVAWKGFAKQFEPAVLTVFTNALTGIQQLFKSIAPAIKGFASALITLQQEGSKALTSPFWKSFFSYLGGQAKTSTLAFGQGLGNLSKGFAALLMAFNPVAKQIDVGWTNMTASFAKWAQQVGKTKGFTSFLHDIQVDGPIVLSVIEQLVLVINNLLRGAEPLGRILLEIIDYVLKLTNNLLNAHKWLRTFAGDIFFAIGAFKLLSLAYGGIKTALVALPAILEGVATAFRLVGIAIDAVGGPWGLLALAVAATVVLMITHWNTIKKWWADFVTWISHAWNVILIPFFKGWGPSIMLALAPFIKIPGELWKYWKQLSMWFGEMWVKVLLPFFKKWGPDILLVLAPFIGLPLVLYQHWSQISKWFGAIWGGVLRMLNADLKQIIIAFTQMWADITKLFGGWIKDAEGFGASIINGLSNGIMNAINTTKAGLATAWGDVTSLFTGGQLAVSQKTAAMVHSAQATVNHYHTVSGSIQHTGTVKSDGLTHKAVQQVNHALNTQLNRKTGGR